MAQTDDERQASNVDALAAPGQAPPGARLCPVLDSGSTIHVFSDGQCLSKTRHLLHPKKISLADGRSVYAYEVGDINTEDIKLKNVYVVEDLKMNLVSVRELTNTGIITTFYPNHAELWKGKEMVGGAIAQEDTGLYELRYLWATGGDVSDTTPEVQSGSEPWMGAAVNGISTPCLEVVVGFDFRNPAADDFLLPKKHFENSPLMRHQTVDDFAVGYGYLELKNTEYSYLMSKFKSLDDAPVRSASLKPEYIRNFYRNNKLRDGSVHVKAQMGLDTQ